MSACQESPDAVKWEAREAWKVVVSVTPFLSTIHFSLSTFGGMSMRKVIWVLLLLVCLVAACQLPRQALSGWEQPEQLSAAQNRLVTGEIGAVSTLLWAAAADLESPFSQTDIDAMERILIEAGYATVDTDGVYPEYLANSHGLEDFAGGEKAAQTVLQVNSQGFSYLRFFRQGGENRFLLASLIWSETGEPVVEACQELPIYDMELADWGIFYYRVYPAGDPHYIDYAQLRMEPVNPEKYDLCRTYIRPVGYQMVNLFLCDWQEGDWGQLSFNDLFEYLYEKDTGQRVEVDTFSLEGWPPRAWIPEAQFEKTLLPYFQISLEEFRQRCGYENGAYPWRPVFGDDLTTWHAPFCDPQVVDARENGDGTLTLSVQVYSPEWKTDCLFAHEVRVRLLDNGGFQYVSNRVTKVGSHGLPPAMCRFALDGAE